MYKDTITIDRENEMFEQRVLWIPKFGNNILY